MFLGAKVGCFFHLHNTSGMLFAYHVYGILQISEYGLSNDSRQYSFRFPICRIPMNRPVLHEGRI